MKSFTDDDVRDRALKLWASAGGPVGKLDQFWYEAERILEEERLLGIAAEAPIAPEHPQTEISRQ